ncbi:MAG: VWA domain-containing protein [Terriglobia bacterium]|jgi:VWFA-related protein
MLPSLNLARRPKPRWPSRLWTVILTVIPVLAPCTILAQTTNQISSQTQASNSQEISSRDVEPTFKLQSERNLVMVRVVVRDAKGGTVDNLRKEDFQLFDHGKLQTISHFSMEKPALKAPEPTPQKSAVKPPAEPKAVDETVMPASTARRFVAMYFDDVNTPIEDLLRARDAADHFLTGSVQPGDRVALYTSSGQKQIDFTDNHAQIHEALFALQARPIVGVDTSCGAIPPYEAFLIVDHQDPQAISVATDEILTCNFQGNAQYLSQAQGMVQAEAMRSLSFSETEATAALRGIESVVRRLTSLPGQRSVVIVSGGFLTDTLLFELGQITDHALRSGVILNAIDARGLYTDPVTSDVTQADFAATTNPASRGQKHLMLLNSAHRQTDGMQSLAVDTGGIFFNNNNDLEAGFRKAAGLPEAFYVLAFSPQNLKLDGAFHPLQVKLVSLKGLAVQARRGYYAPKKPNDPTVQEKEEIEEAVFSQDETHELPIDVHTQFFMKTESDARITVLTRIDLRPLHFRKEADRNLDDLTFVTVVFDQDGHMITGQQKSVQLRLLDNSLERYLQTGITMRTLFDVKPGTYLVRAIVRDSESGQISGLNRTVEIPY